MARRKEEIKIFERRETNWAQIMFELRGRGICTGRVARHLGVQHSVATNWSKGGEPKHAVGEALLDLHAEYCCTSTIFTAQVT